MCSSPLTRRLSTHLPPRQHVSPPVICLGPDCASLHCLRDVQRTRPGLRCTTQIGRYRRRAVRSEARTAKQDFAVMGVSSGFNPAFGKSPR